MLHLDIDSTHNCNGTVPLNQLFSVIQQVLKEPPNLAKDFSFYACINNTIVLLMSMSGFLRFIQSPTSFVNCFDTISP